MEKVFVVTYNRQADYESSCLSDVISIHKTIEGARESLKEVLKEAFEDKDLTEENFEEYGYYSGVYFEDRVSIYNENDEFDFFAVAIKEMELNN